MFTFTLFYVPETRKLNVSHLTLWEGLVLNTELVKRGSYFDPSISKSFV